MGHTTTQQMSTSLRAFECAVQDGELISEGARVDGHTFALREAWRHKARGGKQRYRGEDIAVGDRVERTWNCAKPGFQRTLGFDTFEHREVIGKPSADSMAVTDHLSWHHGASRAQRQYAAVGSDAGIAVTLDPWRVKMDGIGGKLRLVRGQVERTMRAQFPKQVDRPLLAALARLGAQPMRARQPLWGRSEMLAHAANIGSDCVTLRD